MSHVEFDLMWVFKVQKMDRKCYCGGRWGKEVNVNVIRLH